MSLSQELITDILNSSNIVDVIANYITVEKKGKNYQCLCPFHNDTNPSMVVSVDKQIYKCFSCGAGGNVFTFVEKFEKVGFVEAVIKVSKIINKPIDESKYLKIDTKYIKNKAYYDVLKETIKFTKYNLESDVGIKAMDYLTKRGITQEIIEFFEIGVINDNNELYNYLKAKGYSDEVMNATNLINVTPTGVYDVFKNRVLFPLFDYNSNPIGFSARTLVNDTSKYLNTSQTVIYSKGNELYNLNKAKDFGKENKEIYIVEGVLDVIALYRANIKNAVATLGTALTNEQITLIKRLKYKAILAFDGDSAGLNATYKAAKLLQANGVEIKIVLNKTQLDFDEIIEKYNENELNLVLKRQLDYSEFILEYFKDKFNLTNYSEKKQFIELIEEEIRNLKNDYDRQNLTHEVQQLTGFKINTFNNINIDAPARFETVQNDYQKHKKIKVKSGYDKAEETMLYWMLYYEEAVILFKENLGYFVDEANHHLALLIIDNYRKYAKIDVSILVDEIKDEKVRDLLFRISMNEKIPEMFEKELFVSLIKKSMLRIIEEEVNNLKNQIKEVNSVELKRELLTKLEEKQLERRRYMKNED